MKKYILFSPVVFIQCACLGFYRQTFAQTTSVTIQYGGYTTQCCSANTTNYFCFNSPDNTNYCGQTTTCNTQSFADPVPAGNIVTQITVTFYSAGCAGGTMTGNLNGSLIGSVAEANNGCLCTSTSWSPTGTTTGNYPCGVTNAGYTYNYGGSNSFQFCASGGQICIDRAQLNISYAPSNQSNPASQPGAITGNSNPCSGTSQIYSISSVSNATSYNWTVPSGWSINSGQGGTSITVTASSTAGSICVTASNTCGTSSPSCLSVANNSNSVAPTGASASPNPICSGSTTLSVSGGSLGTGASWNWYSGSCGGTFVGSGTSVVVSPSSSTTYFVLAQGTCNTTSCASTTVTFNTPSTDPTGAFASQNPTCGGATTVTVSGGSLGTGANWNWYAGGCGGPSVGTGSSISVSPASTTTYFVQATGTCNTTTCSSVTINVDQAATANAGSDGSICGSGTYSLAGAIGGTASSLTWSSSGTGGFNNTSLSNATYTPSGGDISGGSVTLTLTTNDPPGPCPSVTDNIILTIDPPATANAGADDIICSGGTYTLNGSIGGSATILSWGTSGTGTFNNPAMANATYTPSAADISAGSVVLTITTNDPAGSCTQATDNMTLTFSTAPTANAGPDNSACEGTSFVLSGAIGGSASSSTWTSTGTGTFNNPALPNAIYTPSGADAGMGTVTLTLTTNAPGSCPAASDNMVLTIDQAPTANANSDASVCGGGTYTLSGSMGGSASSSGWTTSGTGTFDNPALFNATYTPSATDISAGSVTLTLTTNDPPGTCTAASDIMILTFEQAATASTGGNASVCSGNSYSLPGTIGGSATSSTWTTSGTGTFDNTALPNAIYTPSGGDIGAGTVTLTLTTDDPPGTCPAASDNMVLTIDQAATANAGSDAAVCAGNTYSLSGTTGGSATALNWTTSGTGTFDNSGLANATYTPSGADITTGTITLLITTNDPAGVCNAANDTMVLTINQLDNASFNYSSNSYCQGVPNPAASVSGLPGGTFSGVAGIVVNSSTGDIDLASSTVGGPYTITYTTNGTCPNSGTFSVSITSSPDATFSYSTTQYCANASNPNPVIIPPASAGTFSASPAGLIFVNTSTGVIDLASSTPGTYVITNDIAATSGCPDANANTTVQIFALDNAAFSYSSSIYCKSASNPTPTVSGVAGGTFSASSGNVVINASTGQIDLSASTVGGPYTITYTTNGTCPNTSVTTLSIILDGDASYNYSASSYCQFGSNPTPIVSGTPGGTFSGSGGIVINSSTGQIDLTASAPGTYNITYSTGGSCNKDSVVPITINPTPNATINPAGPFCQTDAPVNLTSVTAGGIWSGNGITNTASGTFNPAVSGGGTFLITYTISGTCGNIGNTFIIVNPKQYVAADTLGPFCNTAAPVPLVANNPNSADAWLGAGVTGTTFSPSSLAPGTYPVYYFPAICGPHDTVYMQVIYTPVADITNPGPLCSSDTAFVLNAVDNTNGIWSGTGIQNSSTGLFNPALVPNAPTVDTIVHFVSNGSCIDWDTTIIFVGKVAAAPITVSDTVCFDGSVVLFAHGINDSLKWYYNSALVDSSNDTMFTLKPPLLDTTVADSVYTFCVQQQNGNCPSACSPVSIRVIKVGASFVTTPADSGEIPLDVLFNNTSFGVDSNLSHFSWTFGDGDSSIKYRPAHTYEDTGDYTITLTVTDEYGVCSETYTATIYAKGTSMVEVPNIFTPNGDNLNDVFNVKHKNLASADGIIYSRWGELIYRWSSIEAGWDGRTLSGTLAPDGVYYYIIHATGKDEVPKSYELTGYVTLVR